jgi:hypothetical protein
VKRVSILIVTILIGAAAPARALCEATCLAPAHQPDAGQHCPSHEAAPDGAAMSAASTAECPAVESARPIHAKLHFALTPVAVAARTLSPPHPGTAAPSHLRTFAPSHLSHIPLRI